MARSKDFRKYFIVTKTPRYIKWSSDGMEAPPEHDDFEESRDKTFWLYEKTGELVGRFSVKSAPQWIMEIYKILVDNVE